MTHCPCCSSTDVDMEFSVCRSCNTYLPTGSFDVRSRIRKGRAGMRSSTLSRAMTHSDKRTESIVGGDQ